VQRDSSSHTLNRGSRRGFTLVELMVAMFLIMVGLVSSAALMATNLRFQRGATSREDMVTIAQEKLDTFRAYQLAPKGTAQWDSLAVGGSLTSSVNGYADSVTTLSGMRYRRRWQIANSTAGTRRLQLRIQPKILDGSAPWKVDFQTLIFIQ
jgi:prepilin-type N-terminal cleavage/methylation domain-containing protein